MADFGGKLRQARERRGISLRQVAGSTKISVAALEALERNDVSRLPGGIFSRGFVRCYAVEVGLDPDETVREFLARFHPESAAPGDCEPSRDTAGRHPAGAAVEPDMGAVSRFDSRQRLAGVLLKIVVVSAALAVLILYFSLRSRTPGAEAREEAVRPASGAGVGAPAAPAGDVPR